MEQQKAKEWLLKGVSKATKEVFPTELYACNFITDHYDRFNFSTLKRRSLLKNVEHHVIFVQLLRQFFAMDCVQGKSVGQIINNYDQI